MSLPARFQEPANFKWGSFTDAGGAKIRYGSLQPQGTPKGTIVLLSGFRETIEKNFEVIRDLTDRGFAVWTMDWHGQGGSDRYLSNPQKMHGKGYDEHIATLGKFATGIVPKPSGPLILVAHSMGAHIGLRYLKEHEGVFDSAVFTSPMCDIVTPGFPRPVAKMMVRAARIFKRLEEYAPTSGDWNEAEAAFNGNKLTSDPVRNGVLTEVFKANPALVMGGATYGWVMHTFNSIAALSDEAYLKSIKTPMLVGISGADSIVEAEASVRACKLMPNCTSLEIKDAKHEIWMERDEIRTPWLSRVSDFLAERVLKSAPSPKKNNDGPRPPRMG